MEIKYLADNAIYAEKVARWIYNEFIKDIRHGISYEQISLNFKNSNKTVLPICLVAMEGNLCVGTVSIVHNDLLYRDYTPWLASLYVDAPYRKRKIGEQLVDKVKQIATEMNYCEIYLRTEHTGDYYRRLGWEYIESCMDEFKLNTDIFKFILREPDATPFER